MFVNTGVYTVQYSILYSASAQISCVRAPLPPPPLPPAQSNSSYQLKCEIKSSTVKKTRLSLVFILFCFCRYRAKIPIETSTYLPSANPIGDFGSGYLTTYLYNGNRPSTSYTETKMVQSDVWCSLTCRMVVDTWFVGSKYLEYNSSIRAENIFFSLILLLIFK